MKKLYFRILKRAARKWVKKHAPYVIGVTGSIGKTTCRMIVTTVLRDMLPGLRVSTSPKNFNTEVGLVLALFEIKKFDTGIISLMSSFFVIFGRLLFAKKPYDVVVLEYGIDHPGDMEYLLHIVEPQMSIFTGLDKVHAVYFESIDDILEEKMKLMQATKEVVFSPVDALYTSQYIENIEVDTLTYSFHPGEHADVGFDRHVLNKKEDTVCSQFIIEQEDEEVVEVKTNLLGQEQAGYISLGIEIGMILEKRLQTIDYRLQKEYMFEQQPGRFTIFAGQFGSTLIDSSYNAAPKSMMKVIENTMRVHKEIYPEKNLVYCLGDMRELGDFSEEEHRALAPVLAQSADAIYLIGEWMTSALKDELEKIGYDMHTVFLFEDSVLLGKQLLADIETKDACSLILFTGSQNTIFLEEAVKQVLRDEEDEEKLCRQSNWWMKRKK